MQQGHTSLGLKHDLLSCCNTYLKYLCIKTNCPYVVNLHRRFLLNYTEILDSQLGKDFKQNLLPKQRAPFCVPLMSTVFLSCYHFGKPLSL